ncbi:MAG: MBL fold metallo-hydrolase [Filimonas sp.]|nr:MBL fold metallo-hydrolase [Filimonas sp.]
MQIEQIYTGCLAQGAYYIESNGEVAIIDPLRETEPYIKRATKDNAKIRYIFETHFHADFVSGHVDLAKKTGATIVYGPTAKPAFEAHVAADNEVFKLGDLTITVLHTPGHTMESSCYLLHDATGKATALFTGDTLFIGDVGRPDLAQKLVSELTQDVLAGHLYDSLRNKIIPLADDIIVYPAHGAGSACGKNMSRETTDTLGHQKRVNYALRPMSKETFIKDVTTGLMPPPVYFPQNVLMNINGYESLDAVLDKGLRPLTPEAFEAAANSGDMLLLDTRDAKTFARGFVPGSVNIGINGGFAPWVGALIPDIRQQLLIVCEPGTEAEVITRLARVGYDNTIGYLQGGFDTWATAGKPVDKVMSVNATSLLSHLQQEKDAVLLDVRKESEYRSQHVVDAENVPLDYINDHITAVKKDKTYYVHCAAGYRSMIFISILKARGYNNLVDVKGGMNAIKESNLFRVTDYVCPITML